MMETDMDATIVLPRSPLDGSSKLKRPPPDTETELAHRQEDGDSAVTAAEKLERYGTSLGDLNGNDFRNRATKRVRTEDNRIHGVANIKVEYLINPSTLRSRQTDHADDDAAEASGKTDARDKRAGGRGGKKQQGGQNHGRQFGSSRDAISLCKSRVHSKEFDPVDCQYGKDCKHEHDIRKYLECGKRKDLETFGGSCPIFEFKGKCSAGWRCRFAGRHSAEVDREDGRKELVQVLEERDEANGDANVSGVEEDEESVGVFNVVPYTEKIKLRKKQCKTPKADAYDAHLKKHDQENEDRYQAAKNGSRQASAMNGNDAGPTPNGSFDSKQDIRAQYTEPPFRASEKRRIYYGPETPVLAPLTTQGNLPFRRLCVSLGAQVTWSEMAMGLPLIQGEKSEWALMKAHESEMLPPNYSPTNVVKDYDNSKDFKFGAQIAGNKPWVVFKTTEVLTSLCPKLRAIDLNCGCPIDLVYRTGAGSALMDTQARLEKMLRGMNAVSNEVPITVKIRMGTKDKVPTAEKLIQRLVLGGIEARESGEGTCGVAAITLHGRSRQQRYTRSADWEYIAQTSNLINKLKNDRDALTDTAAEPDVRDAPPTNDNMPYFIGNGDVYSHNDYYDHLAASPIDSVMIGRGALMKPWIFEEIAARQSLDKSASERLSYIEQFARNGLEYWGSDEIGVGTTRRFLLEWLSFSCRYVPSGILEHLPPRLGDRPPAFRGRSDLESLLCSGNYKDWIKISEMFLGPAHKDFRFEPKHKSNSYEMEAEG